MIVAEVDPNVRVRRNQTFCAFEDCSEIPAVGDTVHAVEVESGLNWVATVTYIDHERRFVYLKVPWREARSPLPID